MPATARAAGEVTTGVWRRHRRRRFQRRRWQGRRRILSDCQDVKMYDIYAVSFGLSPSQARAEESKAAVWIADGAQACLVGDSNSRSLDHCPMRSSVKYSAAQFSKAE